MKKAFIVAAVLSTLGSSAFAAGAFDGPYVELGAGIVNKQAERKNSNGQEIDTVGKNNIFGQVASGYSYSFDQTFNIAANIFGQFGENNVANTEPINEKIKLKNIFGLSIEPGFYLAEKTLAYTKLGIARGTHSIEHSGSTVSSDKKNGFLYGIGVKHLITSNAYVGLEIQKIDFQKVESATTKTQASQLSGSATVGYKF